MLIVTEGTVTEVQYFEGLAQHFRNTGVLVYSPHTKGMGKDPMKVVNEAIDQRTTRDRNDEPKYDEVWAVVDVDEHATLPEAISSARRASLPIVISNPCFEIWLVWHFVECNAHQSKDDLRRRLKAAGLPGKAVPHDFPHKDVVHAERRAIARHPGPYNSGENPASTMSDLIAVMRRT